MHEAKSLLILVEDDSWTRYALARILGQHGWKVVSGSTVAEGLSLLGSRPSCVILDLQLSDGDGAAVLRQIREDGLDIRVVVCTAVIDERRLEGVKSLRPDAIVHKPIEMNELLSACRVSEGDASLNA
jgi:DNA-binding response OmpR family regulator